MCTQHAIIIITIFLSLCIDMLEKAALLDADGLFVYANMLCVV